MMVLDSELVASDIDFLVAAFESQICEKCNVSGQIRMATKTQVKPGMVELELTCMKCFEKSKHKSDSRNIESKFRPKAWLPNYLLLSLLLNGEYFKDYEHVLGTLGVSHLSKSQWIRVVKWVHLHVKDLAQWSCDEIKREIARRGDKKSLEIMYDGFLSYTRVPRKQRVGYYTWCEVGENCRVRPSVKKRVGVQLGWDIRKSGGGYLRGAVDWPQGRALQREGVYNRPRRNMCNVLLEQFPEAEVIYCGNHTIKTLFHSDLANIKKISCQVRQFFIPLQCLFFSQRTLTTNIRDIISLLFFSVNMIMRYRCSEYY